MIEQGRNIIIFSGATGTTKAIAAAKSCTITKKSDIFEKSSSTSAKAKEYIEGRTEWDVSINHLVLSDAPFEGILKVNNIYHLRITIGNTTKEGDAICTQAEIGGTVGSLATGSIKFKGTGELS